MERQEAHSLRKALEEMDIRDEARLHAAAQDEASDLVWQHRNPGVPYRPRDGSRNYRQHLEKGSHARSQSVGYAALGVVKGVEAPSQRSASDGSTSSKARSIGSSASRVSSGTSKVESKRSQEEGQAPAVQNHALWDSPQKKAYMNLSFQATSLKAIGRRKVSGPKSRKSSGGLFSNPDDKIYEEPDDATKDIVPVLMEETLAPAPLRLKSRNSIAKLNGSSFGSLRSKTIPDDGQKRPFRSEIHRNPPSQSRNASYLQNEATPGSPKVDILGLDDLSTNGPKTKDGIEVRSDDIRAATSMRMKDRSPKLPLPTVVSDRPGRPIISFDKHWKPKEIVSKHEDSPPSRIPTKDISDPAPASLRPKPQLPMSAVSAPAVPTINVPEPLKSALRSHLLFRPITSLYPQLTFPPSLRSPSQLP